MPVRDIAYSERETLCRELINNNVESIREYAEKLIDDVHGEELEPDESIDDLVRELKQIVKEEIEEKEKALRQRRYAATEEKQVQQDIDTLKKHL